MRRFELLYHCPQLHLYVIGDTNDETGVVGFSNLRSAELIGVASFESRIAEAARATYGEVGMVDTRWAACMHHGEVVWASVVDYDEHAYDDAWLRDALLWLYNYLNTL